MNKVLKTFLGVAALVAAGCCTTGGGTCACPCGGEPKISVFAHFVKGVAKERNVSLTEAADMLYDLGVRGFDSSHKEKGLDELAASKLKPINFYVFPNMLGPDGGAADCKEFLDAAEKYGVPRCMVVPSNFTAGGDEAAEFEKILASMKMMVAEAKKRGITITVEDFGGTRNPCSHLKYLKRFLDEIPDIRLALDSGNLYYAGRGEDVLELMAYAKGRIAHVHLKDQTKEDNHRYATLGLGVVPNEKIVKSVHASGYDGWYTLENTVPGADTYVDTVRQMAVMRTWLSGK